MVESSVNVQCTSYSDKVATLGWWPTCTSIHMPDGKLIKPIGVSMTSTYRKLPLPLTSKSHTRLALCKLHMHLHTLKWFVMLHSKQGKLNDKNTRNVTKRRPNARRHATQTAVDYNENGQIFCDLLWSSCAFYPVRDGIWPDANWQWWCYAKWKSPRRYAEQIQSRLEGMIEGQVRWSKKGTKKRRETEKVWHNSKSRLFMTKLKFSN